MPCPMEVLTISTDVVELDDAFIKTHGYGEKGCMPYPQLTNSEEMRKETPYISAVSLFPEIENT